MYRREAYASRRRSGDFSPRLLPAVYGFYYRAGSPLTGGPPTQKSERKGENSIKGIFAKYGSVWFPG